MVIFEAFDMAKGFTLKSWVSCSPEPIWRLSIYPCHAACRSITRQLWPTCSGIRWTERQGKELHKNAPCKRLRDDWLAACRSITRQLWPNCSGVRWTESYGKEFHKNTPCKRLCDDCPAASASITRQLWPTCSGVWWTERQGKEFRKNALCKRLRDDWPAVAWRPRILQDQSL
jgi:hypothetical protein